MIYYILYPGDGETATINDINQLGEDNGFKVFWAGQGFRVLLNAVQKNDAILEESRIIDETGKQWTIQEFLDQIKGLQIRLQED